MDYDSARHHLEAVQNAKKKDEAKTAKVKKNKPSKTFLPSLPMTVAGGGATLGLGNDQFNIQYPQRNSLSFDTDTLRIARDLRLGRAWVWGRSMVPSQPSPGNNAEDKRSSF